MAARPEDIPGVVSSSGILPAATLMGPEELQRRRAIAVALASRAGRPFPKTIGEGLTSLGEAFGGVRGIAGGAILGDGRVGLILDAGGLLSLLDKIASQAVA